MLPALWLVRIAGCSGDRFSGGKRKRERGREGAREGGREGGRKGGGRGKGRE